MRRFLHLAFIGMLLMKNATPKNQGHPSNLAWLFGLNNKLNENKEENKKENMPIVCQTQECIKIARILSESMDKSVDPCDDFYKYACGKWPEHNPIPEGMDSWNMFYSAQKKVIRQIKEIFDEGPKDDDLLAIKLAKMWYTACTDTDAMDRRGLEPIVFTLSRIGGWPMVMEPDEWNEEEYTWQKVDDQYMRLTGRNAFHDVRKSDSSEKMAHIGAPHLLPGSYKLLNDVEEEYKIDDPSNEENQSDEQNDSQDPGSEGEDHDKSGNKSSNDNENDNDNDNDDNIYNDDDDDDDADDDGGTNEQDDKNAKEKVGIKKVGKFMKNKKVHNKKIKSSTHSKKYENYKLIKGRIKRRAILTNVREKLRPQKNERNHVKQTHRQSLKKTLEATTPQIGTEEATNENNKIQQYANYISKVAHAIAKARGVEVSEENMNKDIQNMIDFQIKLFNITMYFIDDAEEMTLNDFQKWYNKKKPKTANSAIDWVYKIGEIFNEAHVSVNGDLNLTITSPGYLKDLIALLDKSSSRTIVNYIHWNFLRKIIKTTVREMRKLYNPLEKKEKDDDKTMYGIPLSYNEARSFKCTREIEMSDILAYEYVISHFSDDIRTAASDMIDDVQKEVEYQIKESEWMDKDTKDFIFAKLVNMEKIIGYPDWYRNNTIVKRYFQGLIFGNSYYENTLSYDRYCKWKSLRRMMQDEDDKLVTWSPIMVNAFFSPELNSIALTAAVFQSPWFAYGRPQAINYGIIGTMMGHEVNHGFDSNGRSYDKNGNVVEWLSAMAEAYGKRAECFVEQFNNYAILKNYKIKNYGNQTAGENIADTMGLEAAFRAYQRRERECGKPDTVLPGLEDLTNHQLFFLSFSNLWCEAETNSTSKVGGDVHSTRRLRVIGTLSNSEDFAKAYDCPVGSTMNPEKKCHIWK